MFIPENIILQKEKRKFSDILRLFDDKLYWMLLCILLIYYNVLPQVT